VGEDAGDKLTAGIFRALFVLDAGTANGFSKGDRFALYYEPTEVKDSDGRVIDRIPGSINLLRAIEVKERVAYCKLESFDYKAAMQHLDRAVDALQEEALDEKQVEGLTLALFGRRAIRIQRTESDAQGKLEDIYRRVLDEERGSASRRKALLELLSASRDFLAAYPGSVLADGAAFNEAWSTMELERYEEAEQLFERFAENYPFSTSLSGAREHLDEIRLRIKLRDSKNAPETQLELAEYLLKDEQNLEEAMRLAFEAFVSKPWLARRMTSSMRFLLAGQRVLHEVLGMDMDAPEEMGALLDKYATDPLQREETRASVAAKAPAERVALLLQLLDSVGLLPKTSVADGSPQGTFSNEQAILPGTPPASAT
jgi:tetratricopeptide (TPR) repeat protein